VGPLDSQGDPLGGNAMVVANAEWRFPIWRVLGGAVFFDAGTVTSEVRQLALDTFRLGTGGSLRIITPVGPLRFDIGYALTPIPGEDRLQFYFALGNPF
jgi:outer membrane translocation and assembly module TamA